MRVDEGREAARSWVRSEAVGLSGFAGAFTHGSLNWLPPGAQVAASSDVDLIVLLDTPAPPPKIGKVLHRGALLDVTGHDAGRVRTRRQ